MKAAIFDMDGTLLDSMPMWEKFNIDFLARRNIKLKPDTILKIAHLTFEETACFFANEYPELEMSCEQVHEEFKQRIKNAYQTQVLPQKGAREYLEYLKSNNVKTALATVTDRHHLEPALAYHDLLKYFDFILTTNECGKNKQYPDIYLNCAKALGASVQDTVVFEDGLYAVKTAHDAGFNVIGLFNERSSGDIDEFKKYCSRVIFDFNDMLQ